MSNAPNTASVGASNAANSSNFPVGSVSTSSFNVTGLSRGPSLPSFPANPSPAGASTTFGNAPSPPTGPAATPSNSPPALPVTINIRVLVAHTGRQLIFQRQSTDSVATLMQLLVQYADIAIQDQILLCEDGVRVYPNTVFSRYPQLLKERGDVFLFNRSHLAMKSKPAKLVDVDAYQFASPALPPPVNEHPLFQFNSALVRALPEFERAFEHHVEVAQAYINVAENRVRQCVTLLDEQKAQLLSVGVAVKNLSCHSALISAPYTKFVAKFDEESPIHKSLLDSFESDLSQLQKVELHPRLRTVDRSTLLDCVPEGKLRAWAKDCGKDYDTLAHKMKKLRAVHRLVEEGVLSCETEGFPTSEFEALDKELQHINRLREEQQTMLEVLRKDSTGAHRMVAEMVQELKTSASTINALDICKALDTQDSHHKQQILPRFEEIYRRMRSAILLFAGNQERIDLFFFKKITKVSELQSSIRDLGSKTTAYTEALTRQKSMFDQLHNLRSLPAAYNACVSEVSRRRKFRRRFLKKTEEVVEAFNRMRSEELNSRDAFQQQYGQSIVREIFPSLAARLPTCELTVKDAEDVLPEIELEADADLADPSSSAELKAEEGSVAAQPGFRSLSPAEQIKRLIEENSSLRNNLSAAHIREEQTQTDSTATAAAIAQLNEELNRERATAVDIARKLSAMDNQIQALREATQRAESERDEKQQIIDRTQQFVQQLETAQKDWKEREQKLMGQHQSFQQEKRDLTTELQTHRDQVQQLKQQIAQQQQQQLQSSRDQQNFSPNQGASVATLSSIVSIPPVTTNAIGSVCRQCYVNQAFVEPSGPHPHPFCGRACAKDYEARRQSALSQQHKLPPSPTNTVSSTLARRPSLGSSGSGINIPNSSSRSGLSPGMGAMPTGGSPPAFSLAGAKAMEKDQHSDCVEKISTLTQSLTAAQQKLRECQANSADLENKFHKAEHELERLRDDKRKLVANITDLQNHLNNMSVNSALLLKAKEELQAENKQLITNNERLRDDREMWMEFGRMRIAFTAFAVKDVVLFYRDEHNNYVAFNKDCPHRYLSPESQASIREPHKFILGEVCLIERRTVPEGENAAVNNAVNPYRLPPGTEFYCLTVETLYTQ